MKRTWFVPTLAGHVVAGATLAAALLSAPEAKADPGLPAYLERTYALSCTPECTLCHKDNNGGANNARDAVRRNGTVGAGFIPTLLNIGQIVAIDPNTWPAAFGRVEQARYDTDQDGIPDIDELRNETDPMDGSEGASICGKGPTYGCVRVARGSSVDGVAALVSGAVLFAGIALLRRRKR